MGADIEILMSTYNGDRYVEQQLTSIIEQSYNNWRLIIRDDGSSDTTLHILRSYSEKDPRIIIDAGLNEHVGIIRSFAHLASVSKAPYVAFCDQDDVWLPNKLDDQLVEMKRVEKSSSSVVPVLVNSDLMVVDENLNLLSDSFWAYQNLKPGSMSEFRKLLVQNYVTGCTVMVNRSLLRLALPLPESVIMHDWWFAIWASGMGKIKNMDKATVMYRQHGKNDTGAKQWGINLFIAMLKQGCTGVRGNLVRTRNQALALLVSGRLSDEHVMVVKRYIAMYEMRWFSRRIELVRMRFYKHGWLRNIAMFIII